MPFSPLTWQDSPSTATPITAANLQRLEDAMAETFVERDNLAGAVLYVSADTGASDANDGKTPDRAKATVAAAVSAMPSAGGTIVIGVGTFACTDVVIKSYVRFQGQGSGATSLRLPNSSAASSTVLITEDFATLTSGDTAAGPKKWALSGLTIDGNKANNGSGGDALKIYGYDFSLRDVVVKNAKGKGIYSQWSSSAGAPSPDSMESHISGVKVHDNDGDGIYWNGPHDTHFDAVVIFTNGGKGFVTGAKGTACQMVNVHVWGTTHSHGFYLESTGNVLANCEGEGASTANLILLANDIMVTGGHYFGGGVSGSKGVVLGATSLPAAGCRVTTKVTSCTAGAVDFANDSGNQVEIAAYQASGAAVVGTRHASTRGYVSVTGGGTGGFASMPGDVTLPAGDLVIDGAGKGLKIDVTSGNAKMGEATLAAGTVQIFTSAITADSYVWVTRHVPGGTIGAGGLAVRNPGGTDRSAGNWFFVSSLDTAGAVSTADTSSFYWLLIEPS